MLTNIFSFFESKYFITGFTIHMITSLIHFIISVVIYAERQKKNMSNKFKTSASCGTISTQGRIGLSRLSQEELLKRFFKKYPLIEKMITDLKTLRKRWTSYRNLLKHYKDHGGTGKRGATGCTSWQDYMLSSYAMLDDIWKNPRSYKYDFQKDNTVRVFSFGYNQIITFRKKYKHIEVITYHRGDSYNVTYYNKQPILMKR